MLTSLAGDVDTRPHPQLGENMGHMRPHSPRREHKMLGNLPVGHTFGDHPSDLRLGRREAVPPSLRLTVLGTRTTPNAMLPQLCAQMGKIPVGPKPVVKLVRTSKRRPSRVPVTSGREPDRRGLQGFGPLERPPGIAISISRVL